MLNQLLHENFVMFALKAKLRVFEVIQKMVVEMIARVIFFAFGNFQTDAYVSALRFLYNVIFGCRSTVNSFNSSQKTVCAQSQAR